MKIIEENAYILSPFGDIYGDLVLKHLELCARTCYKSEDKITNESAERMLRSLIKSGHEAAIEHYSITAKVICDRAVQNEIVRHRLASFCVESTRYCNYGSGKFDEEITVIKPCFFDEGSKQYTIWKNAMEDAERAYMDLLALGAKPQEARDVLPLSLKTEVVMTANVREWRHFFELRTSKAAHPQMQRVAKMLLRQFRNAIPVVFDDVGEVE